MKGGGGLIPSTQQLGLSDGPIRFSLDFHHKDITVDAWGEVPPEIQFMNAEARISMSLVHFDSSLVDLCLQASMGSAPAVGAVPRAGTLMGSNAALGSSANSFISVNILSPVAGKPILFLACYLAQSPYEIPLGTEKSIIQLNWRCIPYPASPPDDPWQGGQGAAGTQLWTYATQ